MSVRPVANVNDMKIDRLPQNRDARGNLVVAEFSEHVPFRVARLFYVHDVPANGVRGQHAHRRCRQYMICQTGRLMIAATDGRHERRLQLNPGDAVLIEPGIFASETFIDPGTVLLVLCDRPYESNDYIRTVEELLAIRAKTE